MNDELMARRIKEKRIEKELTMEQLGNIVGVQKSAVNKWEHGIVKNMKRSTIAKLADALGVSPAYLMGWDDKQIDALKEQQAELEAIEVKYDLEFTKFTNSMYELQLNADEMEQLYLFAKFLITRRRNG